MSLESEIEERGKEISTESYGMSVGEMISLYKDEELDIHPEFQRFFRWSSGQKSRFIESLLLGIPIPSIFVSQKSDGKWDVIDGVQRLSTILQLTGDLKNEQNEFVPPLVLEETRFLPEMKGKCWDTKLSDKSDELPQSAKLKIKRARLDLKIVLSSSDPSAKYELFDRLNTGGSLATDQEVRSCILVMVNREFFEWISGLAADENFRQCIPLSERAIEEQYDLELVVRFLVFRSKNESDIGQIGDIGPFLTDQIVSLAESKTYDQVREERAFKRTFEWLAKSLGENSFKKFDPDKDKVLGALLISVFEVMALGLGYRADDTCYEPTPDKIKSIHRSLWKSDRFISHKGSGISASSRIPVTIRFGRDEFA